MDSGDKMTASKEQLSSVFGNHLISERILSEVNYTELKSLKQVCREFYGVVKNSRVYQDFISSATFLEVTRENLRNGEYFSPANLQGKAWRGVQIGLEVESMIGIEDPTDEGYVGFDVIDTIKDIVEHSPSVAFYGNIGLDLEPEMQFMIEVLSLAKTMETLTLDIALVLDFPVFENILKSPDVVAKLKSLKSLKILDYEDTYNCFSEDHSYFASRYVAHSYGESADMNFKLLATVPFNNLTTFRISKSLVGVENKLGPNSIGNMKYIPGIQHIPWLLRRSRETLGDIAIHFEVWENEEMRTVTLPKLKRLTVTLYTKGQETLAHFLNNHPSLEELDVDLRPGNDTTNFFSSALLEAIKRRSPKLKKLHLKTRKFDGGNVDWSFLKKMENLRDFCVVHRSSRWNSVPVTSLEAEAFGKGPRFLELLPKNQLDRLSLNGLYREVGFWNLVSSGDDLTYKLNLVGGFRNLKRLRLFACRDSVNDEVMQFILKEMKLLEELEVSHCDSLTDTGIFGTPPSASIANLKALKILTIVSCPFVTPAGVLSSVRLPFLENFKYVNSAILPLTFIVEIARQNPRLEGIYCNYDQMGQHQPWDLLGQLEHAHLKFVEYETPDFLTDGEADWLSESDPEEEPESEDDEGEISEDEEDEGHMAEEESEDELD